MNTKQRTTTKARSAKPNKGETPAQPQPKTQSNEERAISALERIAYAFEHIARSMEIEAQRNCDMQGLIEKLGTAILSEVKSSQPRRPC